MALAPRGARLVRQGEPRSRAERAGGRGRPHVERAGRRRRSGGRERAPRMQWGEQIEGIRAVEHALSAGRRNITRVIISRRDDEVVTRIRNLAAKRGADVVRVPTEELEAKAQSAVPQGVIAVGDPLPRIRLADAIRITIESRGYMIASDGIEDPQNLGAIIRTAAALGACAAIIPERRGAPLSPTALKAAAGAAEYVDLVPVAGLPQALATASSAGLWTVALDPGGEVIYGQPLLAEALVLVVGAEGHGLSRLVTERADLIATVPISGVVESLNASAAAAAACSEIVRIRTHVG